MKGYTSFGSQIWLIDLILQNFTPDNSRGLGKLFGAHCAKDGTRKTIR